jgi:transglutaminase-like putative cysteine protease/lipoprotein NlpI
LVSWRGIGTGAGRRIDAGMAACFRVLGAPAINNEFMSKKYLLVSPLKLALLACHALFSLIFMPTVLAQTMAADHAVAPAVAASIRTVTRDQAAENAFRRDVPEPTWVDRITSIASAAANAPVAPVNVRLNDVYFYVDAQPSTYIHRATQVNEAALLAQIGQTEISFQPDYQQVQLHVLRIHRGTQIIDKIRDADIRFLRREPELDNGIYGGSVSAAIVINDVRVGDTLEIAYTITGSNPVFGNRFFDAASWDHAYPIQQRRVTLNTPEQRHIQYRLIGSNQRQPPPASETHVGGRRIVRFEARNLVAIDFEQYTPRDYQTARWLQFSEFASWQEVSQWADKLFTVAHEHIPPLSVAGITPGPEGLPDKVSQALQFVQNNIRYLSVSLGENSHRPYPPDQVLARRYGDCKDKSLLLVSLLRQLNVEAAPVLVPTAIRKGLTQMLPSPQMFDHAIVRAVVLGQVYYLDPTRLGQSGHLDRMGQAHANTQVLVVAADTDQLSEVPAPSNPDLITDTRIERVTVSSMKAPALMSVQLLLTGVGAETARASLSKVTPLQLHKFYEGNIGKRHPDAVMLGEPKITDDRDDNRISIELQFRVPDLVKAAQPNWTVHYQPSNLRGLFFVPDNANRNTPLAVPTYPSINRYQFEVTLPAEYDARYTPSQRHVNNPAFSLDEALSFTGNHIKAALTLTTLSDRVAARDTSQFLTDLNKASEMLQGSLPVRASDLKSAQLVKPPSLPLKQALLARFENIINSSNQVINDAQLTGRDISAALCERARAQAYLGRGAQAISDIRNAGGTLRSTPAVARCRAEVELAGGDFKAAEQSFSRAQALGQNDVEVYLQHGIASFYLNQWDGAASDFARARDVALNQSDKMRARIWRTLAQRRAGQQPDSAVAGPADEVWPGVALAMLYGRKTPETVLRVAQGESGNAGEVALAEAYFYVGEYYLLNGETVQSRVYFQHAMDKGVVNAPFHAAARQEIAQAK